MTIRDSLYFIFDDKKSIDYGIINVNISTGMQDEPLSHPRSINEIVTRGRSKPYFQDIKKEPLKFTVNFAFEDSWDRDKLREVARWLTEQNYYKPLIFSNDMEKIYYALVVDDPNLVHNCLNEGYVTLNFRCNDSYAYSPVITSKLYDWDEIPVVVNQNDFSNGTQHGLVIDGSGNLSITQVRPTWADDPPTMTWNDE